MEYRQGIGHRVTGQRVTKALLFFVLGVTPIVFFFLYSFLSFESLKDPSIRLNSPDETANYFFSRLYARTGKLGYQEQLLGATEHFLHPRSMTGVNQTVVPVSFIGMPVLYGGVGKVFGVDVILFITPFLATIIPFLFYRFLRGIFSRRIAFISAIFLAIHPAYWYFANRSMMHNFIFFGLLIAGFCVISLIPYKREGNKRHFFVELPLFLCAGLLIGASLMVRFSELVWIAPLLVLIAYFCARQLSVRACFVFLIGMCVPVIAILYMNAQLYGSAFSFGYHGYQSFDSTPVLQPLKTAAQAIFSNPFSAFDSALANTNAAYQHIAKYILPFGYEPTIFFENFYQYGGSLFWWFALPLGIGMLILLRQGITQLIVNRQPAIFVYLVCGSFVAFWLVAYYGSWVVQDNITNIPTIGNSYVRYWLPVYALFLPGIAWFFVFLFDRAWWWGLQRLAVVGIVAMLVLFSFRAVAIDSNESLIAVQASIKASRDKLYKVLNLTEPNAVIASQRSDKIFFPERRVMESLKDFSEAPLIKPILDAGVPVYYYGLWNAADAAYISRRYFNAHGFSLEHIADIADGERLFAVKKNY